MKKALLILMSLFMIVPNNNNKKELVKTSANSGTQAASKYLELDPEDTRPIFINAQKRSGADNYNEKYSIIFFNANPAHKIKKILKIKYIISDIVKINEKYEGVLDNSKTYDINYRYNREFSVIYNNWTTHHTTYNYNQEQSQFLKESTHKTYHRGFAYHQQSLHINMNELGRVSDILKLNDFLGSYKAEKYIGSFVGENDIHEGWFRENLLFKYGNSKGYSDVDAFLNEGGIKKDYQFYLILPIKETTGLQVMYIAADFIDEDGKVYSSDIEYEELETPGKLNFKIEKENGLVTKNSTAVYVPSENNIKLSGYKVNSISYKNNEEQKDVYLFAGNIFQRSIEEIRQNITYARKINPNQEEHPLDFKFNIKYASFLIDIPEEVTDISLTLILDVDENYDPEWAPHIINLLDKNGNYGIIGELPEDKQPVKSKSLWDWFKGLFDFGGTNYFDQFVKVIQIAAVGILGLIVLLAIIKLFGFIGLFFKK